MKKKITCLSLDCPERKSVCCGAGSIAVQGDEGTGHFACKNCGKEFIGGRCRDKRLPKQKAEVKTYWKADFVQWTTCPHCKKIIISSSPEAVGGLKKWQKQFEKGRS